MTYTAPWSVGVYTFSYTVSDGNGGTDTGDVTITVTSGEEECDPELEFCEIE